MAPPDMPFIYIEDQIRGHCAVHALNHLLQRRVFTSENKKTDKIVDGLVNMHYYCMLATSLEMALYGREKEFDALDTAQKLNVMQESSYCNQDGNYRLHVIELCLSGLGFSYTTHWNTPCMWDRLNADIAIPSCAGLIICLQGHYTALSVVGCWDNSKCFVYIDSSGTRWALVDKNRIREEISALAGGDLHAVVSVFRDSTISSLTC